MEGSENDDEMQIPQGMPMMPPPGFDFGEMFKQREKMHDHIL